MNSSEVKKQYWLRNGIWSLKDAVKGRTQKPAKRLRQSVFAKRSILGVWQGCEYACALSTYSQVYFFKIGFTPCNSEQPLWGIELQEKEARKRLQHTGNLFRKNLQLKDVC